jgi:hypothetical protein
MPSTRAKRIPVPLDDRQYEAVKAIGEKEERPMAWILSKALDEWMERHAQDYPGILSETQMSLDLQSGIKRTTK